MNDLAQFPTWFLAVLTLAAGVVGCGFTAAIDHLITRRRR